MLLARAGHEAEQVDDLGAWLGSPGPAAVMSVFMFSLAGIPPTVGFYAKLAVLQAMVSTNVVALHLAGHRGGAAVAGGGCPTTRVIKVMDFDELVDAHLIASTRRGAHHPSRRSTAPRSCCSASCPAA